jgi:hypothetical protein
MTMTRTTFLEAVNRVLQMMGEAPVNSLNGQLGLAQQAQDILRDISRKVQSEGWSFNTDYERTLPRNQDFEIPVGVNVSHVEVDPYLFPELDVVQRGDRLYDRRANSYAFDYDLKANVTYILEWEELPEHARQFIVAKGGRMLQEAILGDASLSQVNMAAEMEAKSLFLEEETRLSDHSMLRGNPNHTGVMMTYMPSRALRRM